MSRTGWLSLPTQALSKRAGRSRFYLLTPVFYGNTIYSYQPTSNSLIYITGCLSGNGYIGPVTGSTYQVPAH